MNDEELQINGKKYQLRQCEVIRFEDEFGHSYVIDDEPVASVTTLLSMGTPTEASLLEYFKRTDKDTQEDILLDAQERGTRVHGSIERLLLGEEVKSTELIRKREKLGIAAFIDFFHAVKPEDIVTEQVVAYKGNMLFAGTLDFIGTVNDRRVLIDFKTGTANSRKHELQVAAYKAAVEQSSNEIIDLCYILHVGTNHKGTRSIKDENGIPNNGVGWNMVQSTATIEDFEVAYKMALFMNNGKYPKPPQVVTFPETWKLTSKLKED